MSKKVKGEKTRYSTLVIDGVKYKTLLSNKFKDRPIYAEKDPGMVKAFIPGTILKIRAKEGKRVKEGDLLLILEAMKMRNVVASPVDGVIRKVNVNAGDKVAKNHLMVEIDHEDNS